MRKKKFDAKNQHQKGETQSLKMHEHNFWSHQENGRIHMVGLYDGKSDQGEFESEFSR